MRLPKPKPAMIAEKKLPTAPLRIPMPRARAAKQYILISAAASRAWYQRNVVFLTPVRLCDTRQTATIRSVEVRKTQSFGEEGRNHKATIPNEKLITPTTYQVSVTFISEA